MKQQSRSRNVSPVRDERQGGEGLLSPAGVGDGDGDSDALALPQQQHEVLRALERQSTVTDGCGADEWSGVKV